MVVVEMGQTMRIAGAGAGADADADADATEGLDTSWKSRRQGVPGCRCQNPVCRGERNRKENGPGKEPMVQMPSSTDSFVAAVARLFAVTGEPPKPPLALARRQSPTKSQGTAP